jgi:Tol biopolymer transport system component/DNA-binding winged helix-turn-helix (wHTH) protein
LATQLNTPQTRVSFGEFELDCGTRELKKNGQTVRLEPQPAKVLSVLVRRAGEIVTRQELIHEVWGSDTFVDFDQGLNYAIRRIRAALEDDADAPHFLETVPKTGYRFIAPIAAPKQGNQERIEPPLPPPPAPARPKLNRVTIAAVATLLLLAAAFWYLSRSLPPPRITAYTRLTHDGRFKAPIGTDGSRLYFDQFSPQVMEQVSVNGGEITPVPLVAPRKDPLLLMDISPDGSNALIGTGEQGLALSPIWVAPILGGSVKRLGDGENEAFSPDGLSVIYSTVDGDIFLARIDGTEKHKLAHVPSMALPWNVPFSWSPDRKAIRFSTEGLLWEMSADGSGLHRLLSDWKEPGRQCCGRWTADGHFYLFVLDSPSTGNQIWSLDERRGLSRTRPPVPVRLTAGPMLWRFPVPGRDATRIFADGATLRGELSRGDPGTGALEPFLGGISAEFVSFSPDGKSVAYVLFPEGTLWKADRDGRNRVQLTGGPDSVYNPRWSPDSKQIVYGASSSRHTRIYLLSADGGKPRRLMPDDPSEMGDPNWSPDGKQVLFGRGVYLTHNYDDLRILDLESAQVKLVPGSANMWSPRWSPNGQYIVARMAKFDDNRAGLPVFDFKTQHWFTLPVNGTVDFPAFSHDGLSIYFLRYGPDQGVLRISVAGGKEERVFDLTNWHITGVFGFSMSLDPSDAPLVLRDTGTDDLYALTLEQ